MDHRLPVEELPRSPSLAERAFITLLRVGAAGGVLVISAANSPSAYCCHLL
jgi:hypothetical protein